MGKEMTVHKQCCIDCYRRCREELDKAKETIKTLNENLERQKAILYFRGKPVGAVTDLIDGLEARIRAHEKTIEELVEALKACELPVNRLWDETKGTEREGTAMSCANARQKMNAVLAKHAKQSETK